MFERWGRELLDAGELAARLVMARARLPWRALPLRPADEGHAEVATGHPAHGSDANLPGFEWGSATGGRRIYVAEANSSFVPYTLGGSGPYAGQAVTGGSWAALDAAARSCPALR